MNKQPCGSGRRGEPEFVLVEEESNIVSLFIIVGDWGNSAHRRELKRS